MKKFILLFTLIFVGINIFAHEKPYFFYGEAGAMNAVPMVGMGMRTQKGIHGFDLSGDCSVNPLAADHFSDRFKTLHIKSLYLVHPMQTGFYLGSGLGVVNEPETVQLTGTVEGVVGYQGKNKMFVQGNVVAPLDRNAMKMRIWPALNIGIGF